MSEAYTRYVQRIAAVNAFRREQEAPEELELRVVQVQRCATVSRHIRVIEAAAQVGNQTLQWLRRDTDANVKKANEVQVRALVAASDKRPQGLQASEPQEFNIVWDNGYSPDRAQWVYKQFGRPVPRMWHYCQFCKQWSSSAAKYEKSLYCFQHCVFASPAACCCCRVSCCLFWEMKSFCLLKYSKSKSIQDSPSQKCARRR